MLEPREADVPLLFLVLVVLPVVAYFLLGKWSETTKKRERISLLAQLAAEEAFEEEAMATASVIPIVATSKNVLHVCARCSAPSTTRCSRCKSVRYCSGKCQIIHWRQGHNQECQQLEKTSSCSSPLAESIQDSVLLYENLSSQLSGHYSKAGMERAPLDDMIHPSICRGAYAATHCSAVDSFHISMLERTADKRVCCKSNKEPLRREDTTVFDSDKGSLGSCSTNPNSSINVSPKESPLKHKSRTSDVLVSAEESWKRHSVNGSNVHTQGPARSTIHENHYYQSQLGNVSESRGSSGFPVAPYSAKYGTNDHKNETDIVPGGNDKVVDCYSDMTAVNGNINVKKALNPRGTKSCKLAKSSTKLVGEQLCSEKERKGLTEDELKFPRVRENITAQRSSGVSKMGIMKMMGLKKSSKLRQDAPELWLEKKKMKVLFPYEEFVKFFHCEVFVLSPRGLVNCGNSCYANAVLQCLTCTKPLVVYWLHRSHSRACCGKDWCLMCELEQHVIMLRESGGPLSPGRILLHMRSINCQIGDGSQEDAHEFLRFLIASMQSICLEGLGGESRVDPRLQETTFIQHTFGGRLLSKVKCLRCHHESERYENIMDLTLEIFGWVESLEDALTQFTTAEDLDGENMYRCGRCASYVRARKQLSIHEAPNILTIVLKRFQEGRYGKINKCITFPAMLDMIPFMTGTGDMPPLYMLYGVVVHLDTQNASFSGHYVSYIKDMEGNWFRIDDTEVHPVPMSQVMSEGAYILFYMRSCPRPPPRTTSGKAMRQPVPASASHCTPKTQMSSRQGPNKASSDFVLREFSSDLRPEIVSTVTEHNFNGIRSRASNKSTLPMMERYVEPTSMEFSDAASSDWSFFTSSDEASFTTESARDSFSTVDYSDTNGDPVSIFMTGYAESASRNTVCCRTFSNSKPQTRFILEKKGYVLDS
ncbi:ubiquitin carboxyl-terminal hydrolase 15 [Mangifera indica]|uniref:ubiquitin carboxyl-terminal hydrolase 15 n=1 Tax=Mangifera indica TaxID=29780 RepID=UPI001CFA5CA8|nr:ubiquitin carboxyl-terminal hydrolase 15 [Mangifera indica]XP_044501083.1 ubiquitin carboxyl-terminal hydrolase 15 [Mangifera indica]XP_044501091.1 ubiquitin carboxyl-terminal hydrolase 15 [Mangifera indica]XP_044501099.1 ubiquitin carboxyl-terminal hydrolase 15 [Mangifera indica]